MCKPITHIDMQDKLLPFRAFALHNSLLEGDVMCFDRWQLLTDEAYKIYMHGQNRRPVTVFEFLMWHKSILPYGGFFRQCDPVVMGAGEYFNPLPPNKIYRFVEDYLINQYNILCTRGALDIPYVALATLHFSQWKAHPWPDGNKRHCRKMTLLGCGYLDIDPIVIRLQDKATYFDLLSNGEIIDLADFFESCTLEYGEDLC